MTQPTEQRKNVRRSARRIHRAAVLVELALLLPIVLLLVTAFLELSRISMLKHTADAAAYEGARAGIVAGATPAEARDAAEQLLSASQIKNWTIDIQPAQFNESTSTITLSVKIPIANNTWIPPFFFKKSNAVGGVTLITERPAAVQLSGLSSQQSGGLGISALGLGL